jgi:two-component system response regulator FixJ
MITGLRQALQLILNSAGMVASFHDSPIDFLEAAPHLSAGCVLLDYWIPPPSGREVQRPLLNIRNDLPVIVMTGKSDVDTVVSAMKAGALGLIEKPFSGLRLIASLSHALETLDDAPGGDEIEAAALKSRHSPSGSKRSSRRLKQG